MKRRLVLLRHAKSDWSGGYGDHARPLNERGRRSAPDVGEQIAALGWRPDVVVSSDATRTTETWQLMADAFPGVEPTFSRRLYLPSVSTITQVIGGLPEEAATAMLIGHNPGFSEAASWLCGRDVDLKTAHAALLETDRPTWADAARDREGWRLVDVVQPTTR